MLRKIATSIIAIAVAALTAIASVPTTASAAGDRVIQNASAFTRGDQKYLKITAVTAWGKSVHVYINGRSHQWKAVRPDHTASFIIDRRAIPNDVSTTVAVKVSRNRQALYVNRYRVTDVQTTPGEKALRVALAQRGDPYATGGDGPGRFDCSGLTKYAYGAVGVGIPRTSRDQRYSGPRVSNPKPGDLVYTPGHVSMYAGGGRVVEAARPGTRVRLVAQWQRGAVYIRPWS